MSRALHHEMSRSVSIFRYLGYTADCTAFEDDDDDDDVEAHLKIQLNSLPIYFNSLEIDFFAGMKGREFPCI